MSYSTPTLLKTRIGPKLYAQLTAEVGAIDETTGNDTVAQTQLNAAQKFIHQYIGNIVTIPVTTPAGQVSVLGGVEEVVALYYLWSEYRAIGESDNPATKSYDDAREWLISIRDGDAILPGVPLRPPDVSLTDAAAGWKSNAVLYTDANRRLYG